MNEQLSLKELIELEIMKRNYEGLVDRILQDIKLSDWRDELYISDKEKIIQMLEILEPEKLKEQKEKLLKEKNKNEEQKEEE